MLKPDQRNYDVVDPLTKQRVAGPFTSWEAAEDERVALQRRWAQGYSVRRLASDDSQLGENDA